MNNAIHCHRVRLEWRSVRRKGGHRTCKIIKGEKTFTLKHYKTFFFSRTFCLELILIKTVYLYAALKKKVSLLNLNFQNFHLVRQLFQTVTVLNLSTVHSQSKSEFHPPVYSTGKTYTVFHSMEFLVLSIDRFQ